VPVGDDAAASQSNADLVNGRVFVLSRDEGRPICEMSAARRAPLLRVPAETCRLDVSSEKTILNACS